ncbi:MAG TPA: hypothetical protein VH601_02635 [Bryobacteraceae bacterium]
MSTIRFVGRDVHAETIAVAEPNREIWSWRIIATELGSIRKLIGKFGPTNQLTSITRPIGFGYALHSQLTPSGGHRKPMTRSLVSAKSAIA